VPVINNHQRHEIVISVSDDVMAHRVPGEPREMCYVLLYEPLQNAYHALSYPFPLLSLAAPSAAQQFVLELEGACPSVEGALWQAWWLLAFLS
jgi:hypothetical protein